MRFSVFSLATVSRQLCQAKPALATTKLIRWFFMKFKPALTGALDVADLQETDEAAEARHGDGDPPGWYARAYPGRGCPGTGCVAGLEIK
jgi:hypothetical protein